MGCCIITCLFALILAVWVPWFTIWFRRMYFTNLKDLVEPNVKFYSDNLVG
jgi:hypothetical protein